jgi:hypothetical protein
MMRMAHPTDRALPECHDFATHQSFPKKPPARAFLKHCNLNTARRLLMQYGWHNINVRDVAIQPVFYYHGQFSADYRKLFGELPSATQINSLTPGGP